MPVFDSDEDDSIELFDLGEEKEDSTGIDSGDEENVNPNVANKKKTNGNESQKGRVESQSTRKSNRKRMIST